MSTFRLLGGAIATAIYTAIPSSEFSDKFPSELIKAVKGTGFDMANIEKLAKAAALGTKAAYESVPGLTPAALKASQHAVRVAYTEAYSVVFLTALGIICALLSRSTDVARKNASKAVLLENEKVTVVPKDVEKLGGAGLDPGE